MGKITSKDHTLVKHIVRIRENRRYREESCEMIVTGNQVIAELMAKIKPNMLIGEPSFLKTFPQNIPSFEVTKELLKKMTALESPPDGFAVFPLPKSSSLKGKKYILASDEIQDPGNLGTILRTATALGWEGIFLLSASVDLFNEKTIRASRGASFLLPFARGSWDALETLIAEGGFSLLVASLDGADVRKFPTKEKITLLLGSEGRGVSMIAKEKGTAITVKQTSDMESLNVAVAAGILMYELKRV